MKDTESNKPPSNPENILAIENFFVRFAGPSFLFAVATSFHLKKEVNDTIIQHCATKGLTIGPFELDTTAPIGPLAQVRQAKERYPNGLILMNLDANMNANPNFVQSFNFLREGLININVPMLIWLTPQNHSTFARVAIDTYLRRSLSTLFFEEPVAVNNETFSQRFTEAAQQSENFEQNKLRIALLEEQLQAARTNNINPKRVANEIVLPLAKAYIENQMGSQAKELLREFDADFDYSKPDTYKTFGGYYRGVHDFDKAIEYYTKALDEEGKITAEETANTSFLYNELGIVYNDKGDLDKAIDYYERALNIDLKLFGEENQNTAREYNNLGNAWESKGDLDKAIGYYERALNIDLKLFGEENPNTATDYNNLGSAWKAKGDLDKAIDYLERALNINLKLFGEENPNTAIRYNNLGLAWQAKGDLDKAIGYVQKSYNTFSKLYGADNPKTKTVKDNLDYYLSLK